MAPHQPLEYAIPTGPRVITREKTADGVWFTMRPRSIWPMAIAAMLVLVFMLAITCFLIIDAVLRLRSGEIGMEWGRALFIVLLCAFCATIAVATFLLIMRRHISPTVGIANGVLMNVSPTQAVLYREIPLRQVKRFVMSRVGAFNKFQLAVEMDGTIPKLRNILGVADQRALQPVLRELQVHLAAAHRTLQ